MPDTDKTTQHTPGPWTTDPEFGHEQILGHDGVLVADCAIFSPKRSSEMARANARLIAASPAMFQFMEKLALGGDAEAQMILKSIYPTRASRE